MEPRGRPILVRSSKWDAQNLVKTIFPRSNVRRVSALPCAWLSALAAALAASAPAFAQDYAARDVGGWTVAPNKDRNGCFITKAYDGVGGTTLLLGLDIDGANHLSVLNDNWSIKPQDRLKLSFRLSSGAYPDHFAVGMASDGKRGFVTNFETKFPTYFAASKTLNIYRGSTPVEQLALDGSGAAVAELRRCVEAQRARPAADVQVEKRSGKIPKDPFASDPKRRPSP